MSSFRFRASFLTHQGIQLRSTSELGPHRGPQTALAVPLRGTARWMPVGTLKIPAKSAKGTHPHHISTERTFQYQLYSN